MGRVSPKRPRMLDLFCGAGGAGMGYHRAGFDVVGVDHRPQPHYPFAFVQADGLEYARAYGRSYDAIHASPPCQAYSQASFCRANRERHPDLVVVTRELLADLAVPFVIENVEPAPLRMAVRLCGLMFGLKVFRHRCFECSHLLFVPPHPTHRGIVIGEGGMCCVVGHGGGVSRQMGERIKKHGAGAQQNKAQWSAAMGIEWMARCELAQAIPPAYTQHLGEQLLRVVART